MKSLIAETESESNSSLRKFFEKCGECNLAVSGPEVINAFSRALKERNPYQLVCLGLTAKQINGVEVLKAIRDLEKRCGVAPEKCVKIIITATSDEAKLVQMNFNDGHQVYLVKPINTQKMITALERLELIEDFGIGSKSNSNGFCENTTKRSMRGKRPPFTLFNKTDPPGPGYFKTVAALPDYCLKVRMRTGTTIHFDFRTRLNTARFGTLMDEELFQSVYTDGNYLIFSKTGKMTVRITAKEFMDLVLIDRTAIE